MNMLQVGPVLDYENQLKQYIKASSNKEPEEMKTLFLGFLPSFISKTAEDVRLAVDNRDKAHAALLRTEKRIALHGESRRYKKEYKQCQKAVAHVESLFERIKQQVDHWQRMLIAFNANLLEVDIPHDGLEVDSALSDLFPQLYSNNPL